MFIILSTWLSRMTAPTDHLLPFHFRLALVLYLITSFYDIFYFLIIYVPFHCVLHLGDGSITWCGDFLLPEAISYFFFSPGLVNPVLAAAWQFECENLGAFFRGDFCFHQLLFQICGNHNFLGIWEEEGYNIIKKYGLWNQASLVSNSSRLYHLARCFIFSKIISLSLHFFTCEMRTSKDIVTVYINNVCKDI